MVIQEQVTVIRELLQDAAIHRTTVSFPQIFWLFDEDVAPHDVYDTLEAACVQIADWSTAIYSAVLAKSGSHMPGDGFFDIFRLHREAEYRRIAARAHVRELSLEQRRQMVAFERDRVYSHATR
ncbi:hypothetical protein QPK32_23390 [Massilia sp. YIM B02763]|uniref:hypothetical protein n=1 Tax=Massilia sp. YIM B02763 TaxID=3050130 RepID=UPI0025B6C5BF|nr:hypothetical protein [Massilia sp. YIM B02763]MDN4056015.1 hypothetical protein [Massilia sp. YIM B02763]